MCTYRRGDKGDGRYLSHVLCVLSKGVICEKHHSVVAAHCHHSVGDLTVFDDREVVEDLGNWVLHLDRADHLEPLHALDAGAREVAIADVERRTELEVVRRVDRVGLHHVVQHDSLAA